MGARFHGRKPRTRASPQYPDAPAKTNPAPTAAANVLLTLDRGVRSEVVKRMLAIGTVPAAATRIVENQLRARVLAGACIGVIRATMRHWFHIGGHADLGQLGLQALDALQDPLPEATR